MTIRFFHIGAIVLLLIGCSTPLAPVVPGRPSQVIAVAPPLVIVKEAAPLETDVVNPPETQNSVSAKNSQIPVVVPCDMTITTVEELLRRMLCVYGQLAYYHDTGLVLTTSRMGLMITTFETHAAHGKFRFEHSSFRSQPRKRTVTLWTDGQSGYLHSTSEAKIERFDMKNLVVTLLGDVGSGVLVPSMLRATGPYPWANNMISATIATGIMENVPCFHLTLPLRTGSTMQLWIGESDSLLRKISMSNGVGTEEVYFETIDITTPLADEVFENLQLPQSE